jgi:4-amino-4-deoxy-L-arabinose transferase-like glycosyltransferase
MPARRDLILLAAASLAALLPFTGKAFNVDETLFLWLGRHIQTSPFDFYGFSVHWTGTPAPMYAVTQNPPLTGYTIAAAAALFGWSERALHLAFLLPALAAVLGCYLVAKRFCRHPLEAALLATLTPVFLVSAGTVMCDVSALAWFCLALYTWMEGLERERRGWLVLSGILAAACALTKYFGASVVPLCLAWALLTRRKPGFWCAALLVPVAALVAYEWATAAMYGRGLLSAAAGFAAAGGGLPRPSLAAGAAVGLLFTGACFAPALFFAPFLWPRAVVALGAVLLALGGALLGGTLSAVGGLDVAPASLPLPRGVALQMAAAGLAGASVLALAGLELARRRGPESALLALWLGGTFVFASFVNWTNNGRSILPLVPPAAILLVRRLEQRFPAPSPRRLAALRLAFAPAAAVALAVAWGDARWAGSIRDEAAALLARHASDAQPLWFEGQWGFQWYMEQGGARPLDLAGGVVRAGERIALPVNNVPHVFLTGAPAEVIERTFQPEPRWVRTHSWPLGAGFYSSLFGPLPYAFGRAPPDEYRVYEARAPFRFALGPDGARRVEQAW